MFDNLKIGTKMVLLSGAILSLLLIILLWGIFGLSTTVQNGIEVSEGNQLRAKTLTLENKHLKWAHTVRNFLDDPAITELKVSLDHKSCALGKWYYGEGRQHAEKILPEIKADLQALEEPHRLMHASARRIVESYNPFSPVNAEARNIYKEETAPNLKKLSDLVAKIAETSKKHIMLRIPVKVGQ